MSTAGDVVVAHLREQLGLWHAQEAQVRHDRPGAVHRMRVTTRRVRSDLTTFGPLFATAPVRSLRRDLRRLGRRLGRARDAEVLQARVHDALRGERPADAAARVDARLAADRQAARERVLLALDSPRHAGLTSALATFADAPPAGPRAQRPAAVELPRLVARSYAEVVTLMDLAQAAADAERDRLWHEARKAAKRTRYALEPLVGVLGPDATALGVALEELQDALGEHHDVVATRARVQRLASRGGDVAVAFVCGRLDARQERELTRTGARVDSVWAQVRSAAAWGRLR
ncbi:CHAD domain-containing protein [Cellulomonas soli]|uniref:CHAD domain-containing protein n=1 Tax=Cellulomonas soli TaxID=931535 RepID=UPI003F86734C